MSFLGNIRALAPRVTRLIGGVVRPGRDKDGGWTRTSLLVMTIIIIVTAAAISASGSLFATGVNDTASIGLSNSVSISPAPPTISPGASLTLTAKIAHSFPNAQIKATITVTGPSGSGVLGSKTITIATNPAGNGLVSVTYPFTTPFVGTSSTSASGTYQVSASFFLVYPIATASTTFTVR